MQTLVDEFVDKLNKRKLEGAQATALQTAELLRSVVSLQKLPSENQAAALVEAVRSVGVKLIAANPVELAIGNIVRRVLHIIREEYLNLLNSDTSELNLLSGSDDEEIEYETGQSAAAAAAITFAAKSSLRAPSLQALLEDMQISAASCQPCTSAKDSKEKFNKSAWSQQLKHDVIEAIHVIIEDINTCHEQIAEQAIEHIHQNEIILTLGRSRTVLEFLCAAKEKKRSFRVFIAEGAPRYQGHTLAKELAGRGLQATVIADAAVFAMVSRVNMVVVGVHAVMANGGIIAPVGTNMVALAARRHGVPSVVVAGIHKFCPLYPHNPEVSLNDMRSPSELLEFGKFSDITDFSTGVGTLHVANPAFDYVPPELVNLVISEIGGHNPSFMYRLVAYYYSADDIVLQEKHD